MVEFCGLRGKNGTELEKICAQNLATTKRVDVSNSFDYEQDHAQAMLEFGRPQPEVQRYLMLAELMRRKIAVGYVNEVDSSAGLKVLIVPLAIVMDVKRAEIITDYMAEGGVILPVYRQKKRLLS